MAFVDYEYFTSLYGADAIDSQMFQRIIWNAEKALDVATTGIDGVHKLKVAFPDNEDDVESIKRCACALVDTMCKIEKANADASGGKVIQSVSAGNESISYAVNGGMIGAVLSDKKAQLKLINETIDEYLRGTKDKNGVNILYLGVYPYRLN